MKKKRFSPDEELVKLNVNCKLPFIELYKSKLFSCKSMLFTETKKLPK